MAIDSHYIPAFSIEDVILDKDTGAPLSGGLVYFETATQPTALKPVYQITGTDPNYNYIALANPMTLSSIGTFVDSLGNPVIPYFLPYASDLTTPDYYNVRVTSSEGVPQFTRTGVPYIPTQSTTALSNVINNELSNPQFSVVNFDTTSSYTYTVGAVTDEVIFIAPDWELVVSASISGTITLTQYNPTGAVNIPTNPVSILQIQQTGLSKLWLRQRIFGSPNLWGDGYLAINFTAATESGSPLEITPYYTQSDSGFTPIPFETATLDASGIYESFTSNINTPNSTSADTSPNAYVAIYFDLPLSTDILSITSIMAAFTGTTSISEIAYEQTSYARQVDQIYHDAYPIVPVGAIIDYGGFGVPQHFANCDGQAYSRVDYQQLFRAITTTEVVALTNTVNTFTVVSASEYAIGMALEGTGIPASTTITNIVGTTITMSNAATSSGNFLVRFFAYGAGDGLTTFNVPNFQGYVTAGMNGGLLLSNGLGYKGGEATHTLDVTEIPAHTHTVGYFLTTAAGSVALSSTTNDPSLLQQSTSSSTGGGLPHNNIQPTVLVKKCIRYQ